MSFLDKYITEHIANHAVAIFPFNPNEIDFYTWNMEISKRFADLRKTSLHIHDNSDLDPILIECLKDTVYELLNMIALKYDDLIELSYAIEHEFSDDENGLSANEWADAKGSILLCAENAYWDILEYDTGDDKEYNDYLVYAAESLYEIFYLLDTYPDNIDIFGKERN